MNKSEERLLTAIFGWNGDIAALARTVKDRETLWQALIELNPADVPEGEDCGWRLRFGRCRHDYHTMLSASPDSFIIECECECSHLSYADTQSIENFLATFMTAEVDDDPETSERFKRLEQWNRSLVSVGEIR